jgi:hypothetical protein
VRDYGSQDHGRREYQEYRPVIPAFSFTGARSVQLVVGGEDLGQDGAELAYGGRDAMA